MSGELALLLLTLYLSLSIVAANDFANCNCDEEGFWSIQSILECQRVCDLLIAVAYFSIPIELLYFISFSNVPFKWVLLQFFAFIVLCGLTHLLNAWTYYGPHSFQLMLSLSIAKFLTALVSCATAITLLTLIPLLLKVKVREVFLTQNVLELDQEVGMMKKQKEASWHVRMLTQEIRKSLDKHTILYTTLVELSKTLDLHNCAVWMPNENGTLMNLSHELKSSSSSKSYLRSIPMDDPDVLAIKASRGVRILSHESPFGAGSSGGSVKLGAVAAIAMPMLRVSNFKGGTPEVVDTHFAILVLMVPSENSRAWSHNEMEIVEVIADQVAVALSHASVLEESQMMREKLAEQNRALQQAKKNAMMANQARYSFQKVMSHGMRKPMHSILGLLSVLQDCPNFEQRIIADTMLKTGNVISSLVDDMMEISAKDNGRFPLEMRHFQFHSMIREASCLAKCLCVYNGYGFELDIQSSLPDKVIGDERRTFQLILHMVGNLLTVYGGGGVVIFRIFAERGSVGKDDKILGLWKSGMQDNNVRIQFDVEMREGISYLNRSILSPQFADRRHNPSQMEEGLSFSMCKKLVKMMQGDIRISINSLGFAQSMTLLLRFQTQSSIGRPIFALGNSSDQRNSNLDFKGLQALLADDDDVNRIVTQKLLEKLGFQVMSVSSGFECLSALNNAQNSFRIVLLDLHMPEIDGFEVAMRIRKFCSRNWPLIVALTASAEEHLWERCLQIGMNGLLRKPVLLRGLGEELKRVLQRGGEGL